MTEDHLDDVFLLFAGLGNYLLATGELLLLLELRDNAGRPIVRVLDQECCELMGAVIEPYRPMMPGVDDTDLWLWRLGDIERPSWLPDCDGLGSLSDD